MPRHVRRRSFPSARVHLVKDQIESGGARDRDPGERKLCDFWRGLQAHPVKDDMHAENGEIVTEGRAYLANIVVVRY